MTFTYKKKGKQIIAVSQQSIMDNEMCDIEIGATHVVTEIKTGFNAFLLFNSLAKGESTLKYGSVALLSHFAKCKNRKCEKTSRAQNV